MSAVDGSDSNGSEQAAAPADDTGTGGGNTVRWLVGAVVTLVVVAGGILIINAAGGDDDDAGTTTPAAATTDDVASDGTGPDTGDTADTPATTESTPGGTTEPTGSDDTGDDSTATTPPDTMPETTPDTAPDTAPATTEPAADGTTPDRGSPLTDDSLLVFRNTQVGETYGLVSALPALAPDTDRQTSDLRCDRLDVRNGRGVCARSNRGTETTHEAVVFDDQFVEGYRVGLLGPPSRVRVSPAGTMAAVTSFVTGHEYESGDFSTQTLLIDLESERVVADLEADFTLERDGAAWSEEDFNYWGVTFADDDRFYATLGTGGSHYLVEGEVSAGAMRVIHENGQCPELSPDGTRLAYRMRVDVSDGPSIWRLAVLDLDTSEVTELAETRTVDDQPTWLGHDTVTYGLAVPDSPAEQDTWAVAADGSGEPSVLVPSAWSTVVFTP